MELPEQSPLFRHCTQTFVLVLQSDVDPLQSVSATHSTHSCVVVLQCGVPPLQFPSARHSTQVLGLAPVSQAGNPGTLAQSAALAHGAHAPDTQAALVALVQFASAIHSTHPPDTQ